jgi:hypothetical protein
VENRVSVEKIWAFEVLGAKWSLQEVLGIYMEFTECLEGLGVKRQGHMWNLGNFIQAELNCMRKKRLVVHHL